MSRYKPYPSYKDSGVEWIGQIPEHWTVSAVKREFDAQLGKMLQPEARDHEDVLVPYHKAVSVQWENVSEDAPEKMWASSADKQKFGIKKGDLLICEGGDVGRAAIFNGDDLEPVIIQNSLHRVRPKKNNKPILLLRLMQVLKRSEWFDVLCSKSTIVHFTAEKLGDLPYLIAPENEQDEIIARIERETTRIDALIAKKTRFIELLKEKRQALITHAVTKGLDPNVKMKASSVEWIGDVPEHWVVGRLSDFCSSISTGPFGTALGVHDYIEHGIPVINPSHMSDGICSPDFLVTVSEETAQRLSYWKMQEGDVVAARRGELGRAAVITSKESGWICGTGSLRLRPSFAKVVPAYLYLLLQSTYARSWLDRESVGSTMPNLNESLIGRLPVAICPSTEEQNQLIRKLQKELDRVYALMLRTEVSVNLLKERRSAFITAAVTGQIDLRSGVHQ